MGNKIEIRCPVCNIMQEGYTDLYYHMIDDHLKIDDIKVYTSLGFNVEKKVCKTCEEEKYKFLFHYDTYASDNYKNHCIECTNSKKYPDKWKRLHENRALKKEGKKKCSRCGEVKTLKEFTKDKYKKDGYTYTCTICRHIKGLENRSKRACTKKVKEKVCPSCKVLKKGEDFPRNSTNTDGLDSHCKSCRKEYREQNREILIEKGKIRQLKNKDIFRIRKINYNMKIKKKFLRYERMFGKKHPSDPYFKNKKYREKNKVKIRENKRLENEFKRKNDPDFNFWYKIRARLRNFLKGLNKSKSTKEIIGYTFNEFKRFMLSDPKRIQEGYSFEDYMTGELTLDHIVPLSLFPVSEEGAKEAYRLENLRLIGKSENCSKINKIYLKLLQEFNLTGYFYKNFGWNFLAKELNPIDFTIYL
jgi:hypothetical protein